jgi:tetratricopeptide (TPR) repeat protein
VSQIELDMNEDDYVNAGCLCLKLGKNNDAIKFFEKAVGCNPLNAIALNDLGFALCRVNRYADAIEHFDEAIEYDPDFAFAYNNRGLAKIKTGKPEEGLKDIQHSLKLKPDNAYSYRNLGIYYLEKLDKHSALNCFERANEIDSTVDDLDQLVAQAHKI